MLRFSLIFVSFFFLLTTALFSQTYYFDNYGVKDGLAQSKVYTILQDQDGYFWLGTESGVSRFDGSVFKNYTLDDGLAESGVQVILEDNRSDLWFGHIGGGISRKTKDGFETINLDTLTLSSDITDIKQDQDGNLWLSSAGEGVFKISNPSASNDKLKFTRYKGQAGLSDRVYKIVILSNNEVFFMTDVGIKQYDKQKDSFSFFVLKGLPSYFLATRMMEAKNGDLWFGTHNGGLYNFDKQTGKFKIYDKRDGLAHNFVAALHEDRKGRIWVGSWGGGMTRIDGKELITFSTSNGLQDNRIRKIIEDREGNILIGTNENGISVYKGDHFIHLTEENGLKGKQGLSIMQSKNGVFWLGTDAGVNIFYPETNKIEMLDNEQILQDQIAFIKEDKNGNVWIATRNNGVVAYSPHSGQYTYNSYLNNLIKQSHSVITSMEIDNENNLWVGTIGGLIYFEIENGKFSMLSQRSGLAGVDISALFATPDNNIWIGSKKRGITRIKGRNFTIIETERQLTPTCFAQSKDGKIWIGTESHGLIIIENDSVIKKIRVHDGLLSDNITLIDADKEGNIYIGTNLGLNKYVPSENKLYTYTKKSGFIGIEVKYEASILDHDGNMWFGTVNGFTQYNKAREPQNVLEPQTHITRLRINLNDAKLKQNLELNYLQNSLVFDYTAICLTNPNAVKYKVMLEGLDQKWGPETKLQQANYPALAPGKYVFKVKACNNLGVWNKEPVSFAFRIAPPFWQTWWFLIGSAVLGIALIIIYVKVREQNLVREKNRLEKKVEERTAEISQKNNELAEKNQNILDSIRYAKRIQDALLPADENIGKLFDDYFILFKPRDIVSGDFYWAMKKKNIVYFVAADCTGHGVPGGFMSMLGIAYLNEIVNKDINNAGEILDELRDYVISSLKQTGKKREPQDGMDLTLCAIDYEKHTMQIAGANNAAYLIPQRKNEAEEPKMLTLKVDKMPIGIYYRKTTSFTNQIINFNKGDRIYFASDGYKDQFGGNAERKFMSRNFKNLLLQIHSFPMSEQKKILENTFDNWVGDLEQVDDVLVAGIKL